MRARLVVVFGVIALMLSACAPTVEKPFPLPKTTGTIATTRTPATPASDVDKAIAVYRDYVAATNALVFRDSTTWNASLAQLSDPYLSKSRAEYEEYAKSGWSLSGDAKVLKVELSEKSDKLVRLHACTDFSKARLVDAMGDPVEPAQAIRSLNVLLSRADGIAGGWRIIHIGESDVPCN